MNKVAKNKVAKNKVAKIAKKPSVVVRALIDGLLDTKNRPEFTVDMSTFGDFEGGDVQQCFGCAATCTLQKMFGFYFQPENIETDFTRSAAIRLLPVKGAKKVSRKALEEFESAVDQFRTGDIRKLLCMFPKSAVWVDEIEDRWKYEWYLSDDNWEEQLSKVEEFEHYLLDKGL